MLDWQLAVGAISLVLGLWFYGYSEGAVGAARLCKSLARRIVSTLCALPALRHTLCADMMRVLGNRLCFHSPSRGFSMELGSAITVLIAARNGIPVSTTNCIVGATMGVGLMNSNVNAVNWKLFGTTFFLWCITLPFCGLMSGCIYALIAYSPKQNCNPYTLTSTVNPSETVFINGVITTVSNVTKTLLYPPGCV